MLRLSLFILVLAAVKQLTADDFDDFIKGNGLVLVRFYEDDCAPCEHMAPDFVRAEEKLKDKVAFAEVNATQEPDLAIKYQIESFPWLKHFNKGVLSADSIVPIESDILEWAEPVTKALVSTTPTPLTFGSNPNVVLYAKELLRDFEKLAEENRKLASFFHVVSDENKVTLQHPHSEVLEHTSLEANFTNFVRDNLLPLVGQMKRHNAEAYRDSGKNIIRFLFPMEAGQMEEVLQEKLPFMQKVANQTRDFGFLVAYEDMSRLELKHFRHLGVQKLPAMVIHRANDEQNYPCYGPMELEPVLEHFTSVMGGKRSPWKSQPLPESGGSVKVAVAWTLRRMAFSMTKDVMLLAYTESCSFCTAMLKEYDNLGIRVTNDVNDFVRIVKIDGSKNNSPVPGLLWVRYPTIFFIKAGSKKIDIYNGERTEKEMWDYIKENAANKDQIEAKVYQIYYAHKDKHADMPVNTKSEL